MGTSNETVETNGLACSRATQENNDTHQHSGDSEAPDLTKVDVVAFTSRLIAAARALESRRPDRLFNDCFAELLAGDEGIRAYDEHARLLRVSYEFGPRSAENENDESSKAGGSIITPNQPADNTGMPSTGGESASRHLAIRTRYGDDFFEDCTLPPRDIKQTGVTGQYNKCTGQLDTIADGRCDIHNNYVDCGYDGGDCCECSCMDNRIYPCGIWGFNCSDPDVLDNAGGCQDKSFAVRTCSSDTPATWIVNNTTSATSLAKAVNCSGGTFNVTWLGNVLVDRTIYIPDGTSLQVTGEGSGAEANGGGKTRLFMAVGADLHIEGLILRNGNATYGGAIAATRSSVFLNQTLSSGNIASSYGGAIYIDMSSTLACEGQTVITGNHAGRGGGGVAVGVKSITSWNGPAEFSFNSAGGDGGFGGAVFVNDQSRVFWDGVTSFVGNDAEIYGGALTVLGNSTVSWDRLTSFVNNTAQYGGGLFVNDNSSVSWDRVTSFTNNTAQYGGSLFVSYYSIVSWAGATSFVKNTANSFGGALHINGYSIASWDGVTSLVDNTAFTGGALYVNPFSIVSCDGVTSFVNNTAFTGGALFVYWYSIVSWNGETSFVDNTANSFGGALYVDSFSIASWDGVTSFVNNTALYGGALYISSNSTVSWDGDTSFVDNTAGIDGGALYISSNSTVSWDGDTSFVDNTAGIAGGALYISYNSTVSWDGDTSFVDNTAGIGGALRVYYFSIVLWTGGTPFTENIAKFGGGALHVNVKSIGSWAGVTSFVNNTASLSGGALDVYSDSSVSWDGETSFVNNAAGFYGGALFIFYSSFVSLDGNTSFVDNTAQNGGALCVSIHSNILLDGEMSFAGNTAQFGGAIYLNNNSIASWDGVTSFIENTATVSGGAFNVDFNSFISWDGETSFVNNIASILGGAFYVGWGSTVLWDAVTSFVNNTAGLSGGALYVYTSSNVSWDGMTYFANNRAGGDGGALEVYNNSIVSWDGITSFVNNRAGDDGGALVVCDDSTASWTGETSFTENIANSSGGVIFFTASSNINVGGFTYFLDNEAAIDGGAVYVYVGYNDAISSSFIADNKSTILFQENTCGGNGGAIAFIGEVFTRFNLNVTFWGNTAGVAGGAIFMSGANMGMLFEGTRFISNSAVIGGGIYSTGNGIAVTGNNTPEYNPTTLIGCEFIGNNAMKTGGAMDSGAGRDRIMNTSFVGNTASLGGALRLVGTTTLIGCEFVENLSGEDEGPGISNDGVIAPISHCSFVDNAFNCLKGFFLAYNETGALFDTVCKGCDTQCSGCTVEGKEPVCLKELKYSTSAGGNVTLESLLIERGYWRATNTSNDILACYNTEACLGGLTGEQGYCGEGYEGPYCSVCSKGYTASLGFACNKCSENAAGGIVLAVIIAIVSLLAFVAFLSYAFSGEMEDADKGIVGRVTRFIPLQSVKIVIVVWQILTQFSAVANVVFPSVYQRFLDGVGILNFDLSWVISAECIIDTDFHDQLLLVTLGPLVCMILLGGTYVTAMYRSRNSEEARRIIHRKHVSMVLLLTFLVYSSVASTLFKMFACDKLDDGKNYLRADYRIECDSSRHYALEIYASFMVVLYVVGIPAFYGVLLYKNREALVKNSGREEDESVKSITDLWKPYRPDRFYDEVIECVRRMLLTGALVFIYPNTAAQIAVALMMTTFFIFVTDALAPYESPWDTWSSRTGQAIVFTSIFLALLLKVDVSSERARSQKVFESVIIAAHSCLVLVVVVEAITMVIAWRKEVKEDMEPRIRSSLNISPPNVGRVGTILDSPPPYADVVGRMP